MNRGSALLVVLLMSFLSLPIREANALTTASKTASVAIPPVQSVAVSPENEILAGTFGEGIFLSLDGGRNWTARNDALTNHNILTLAAKGKGFIFAGTFGGGVFRAEEEGAYNWEQVNSGLDCLEITSLVVDREGYVFAGSSSGIVYRSEDNGDHWLPIGDCGEYINCVASDGNGLILVATSHGIQRSTDSGMTWRTQNTGLGCLDVWSMTCGMDGDIFAATNGGGVYQSRDNGTMWMEANNGLESKNAGSIAVCTSGKIFVGTTEGVFVSSDDGRSWSKFVADQADGSVRCLTVGVGGQLLIGRRTVDVFSSNPIQPLPEYLNDGV